MKNAILPGPSSDYIVTSIVQVAQLPSVCSKSVCNTLPLLSLLQRDGGRPQVSTSQEVAGEML